MHRLLYILLVAALGSCKKKAVTTVGEAPATPLALRGADLSLWPLLEAKGIQLYNRAGLAQPLLQMLQQSGLNVVRLRLWHSPATAQSSFTEVKNLAARIHAAGLKLWLTVHYSDTWADPGHQSPPAAWQGKPFAAVKDSLYAYTKKIVAEMQPEYIQIGNEINPGLLLPYGDIATQESQFVQLLAGGCKAVRDQSATTKIMIHYAGITGADWFFNKLRGLDYDMIAVSFYPIWHGKDLAVLQSTLQSLAQSFNKPTVIAETAYPFTLQWNDWTNNILGSDSQLAPGYPATPEGQLAFMNKIRELCRGATNCAGFCYWGGEWVAYNGPTAPDGSPWENMALYDFTNKALPVITAFAN